MMLPKYRWLPSNDSRLVSVVPSGLSRGTIVAGAGPSFENMSSVMTTGESSMSSGIDHASTCAGKVVTGSSTFTGAIVDGTKYGRYGENGCVESASRSRWDTIGSSG